MTITARGITVPATLRHRKLAATLLTALGLLLSPDSTPAGDPPLPPPDAVLDWWTIDAGAPGLAVDPAHSDNTLFGSVGQPDSNPLSVTALPYIGGVGFLQSEDTPITEDMVELYCTTIGNATETPVSGAMNCPATSPFTNIVVACRATGASVDLRKMAPITWEISPNVPHHLHVDGDGVPSLVLLPLMGPTSVEVKMQYVSFGARQLTRTVYFEKPLWLDYGVVTSTASGDYRLSTGKEPNLIDPYPGGRPLLPAKTDCWGPTPDNPLVVDPFIVLADDAFTDSSYELVDAVVNVNVEGSAGYSSEGTIDVTSIGNVSIWNPYDRRMISSTTYCDQWKREIDPSWAPLTVTTVKSLPRKRGKNLVEFTPEEEYANFIAQYSGHEYSITREGQIQPLSPEPGELHVQKKSATFFQVGASSWIHEPYKIKIESDPEHPELPPTKTPMAIAVGMSYDPVDAPLASSAAELEAGTTLATIEIWDIENTSHRRVLTTTVDGTVMEVQVGGGNVLAKWDGYFFDASDTEHTSPLLLSDSGGYKFEVTVKFQDKVLIVPGSGPATIAYPVHDFTYEYTQSFLDKLAGRLLAAMPSLMGITPVDEGTGASQIVTIDPYIDPVNLFTGEFYLPEVDIRIPGNGIDFTWHRQYRSRFGTVTPQGNNWDIDYDIRLNPIVIDDEEEAPEILELLSGNSTIGYFARQENDEYRHPSVNYYFKESDGKFIAYFPDGGKWEFNSDNRLKYITHKTDTGSSHVRMHFSYDDDRLSEIEDTVGRRVFIEYYPEPDPEDLDAQPEGFIKSVEVYPPDGASDEEVLIRGVYYDYFTHSKEETMAVSGLTSSFANPPVTGPTIAPPGTDLDQDGRLDGVYGDLRSVTVRAALASENDPDTAQDDTVVCDLITRYAYSTGNADDDLNGNLTAVVDAKGNRVLRNSYLDAPRGDINHDRIFYQSWGDTGYGLELNPVTSAVAFQYQGAFNTTDRNIITYESINNSSSTEVGDRHGLPAGIYTKVHFSDRTGAVREYVYNDHNLAVWRKEFSGRIPDYQTKTPSGESGQLLPWTKNFGTGAYVPIYDETHDGLASYDTHIAWTDFGEARWIETPGGQLTVYIYSSDIDPEFDFLNSNNLREIWELPDGSAADTFLTKWTPTSGVLPYTAHGAALTYLRHATTGIMADTAVTNRSLVRKRSFEYKPGGGAGCGCVMLLQKETDEEGHVTQYIYDDKQNLALVIHPQEAETIDDLNDDSAISGTYFPVSKSVYDSSGRLTDRYPTSAFGGASSVLASIDFSGDGPDPDLVEVSDLVSPRHDVLHYGTDGLLDQIAIDSAGENIRRSFVRDRAGLVTSATDPRGFTSGTVGDGVTEVERNALGWVLRVQLPHLSGNSGPRPQIQYRYDLAGNVVSKRVLNLEVANDFVVSAAEDQPWFKTRMSYDTLGYLTSADYERFADETYTWEPLIGVEYDRNREVKKYVSPKMRKELSANPSSTYVNSTELTYDSRGLLFTASRNPGTNQEVLRFDYDFNGNVTYKIINPQTSGDECSGGFHAGERGTLTTYDEAARFSRFFQFPNCDEYIATEASYLPNSDLIADVFGTTDLLDPDKIFVDAYFEYDAQDRLRKTHQWCEPGSGLSSDNFRRTTYHYLADSRLSAVEDDNGFMTKYAYDSVRRLHSVTDELTNSITYSYDKNSNVTGVLQADKSQLSPSTVKNFDWVLSYDGLNQMTQVEDPEDNSSEYGYDSRGNPVIIKDARAVVTRNVFDSLGRLEATIRNVDPPTGLTAPASVTTSFEYDDNSLLTKATDPEGNASIYAYNNFDRIVSSTRADGTAASVLLYNAFGEPRDVEDANGTVVRTEYDGMGRPVSRSATGLGAGVDGWTTKENYEYDGLSRLTRGENLRGTDGLFFSKFEYSLGGNLIYESINPFRDNSGSPVVLSESDNHGNNGNKVWHFFEDAGSEIGMLYPSDRWVAGSLVDTERDQLYRPRWFWVTAEDSTAEPVYGCEFFAENSYVGPGQRLEARWTRNGTKTAYAYDDSGRLNSLVHQANVVNSNSCYNGDSSFGSPITFDKRDDVYDEIGNRKSTARSGVSGIPDLNLVFDYDALSRLKGVARTHDSGTPVTVNNAYGYDKAQNRTSATIGTNSLTYAMSTSTPPKDDQVNQYTAITPTSAEDYGGDLSYDANGNLIERTDDGTERVYTYDFNNRLALVTIEGVTTRLRYDALGRMVEKEWEDEPCAWAVTDTTTCGEGERPTQWTNSCTGEVITADEDHDGCEDDSETLPDLGNHRVQYAYAGWRILEERDPWKIDYEDPSNFDLTQDAVQKVYFYGSDSIDDVMILRVRGSAYPDADDNPDYGWPSTDLYLAKDALGSTVALVSRDGNVVERYEYGDYGEPIILEPDGETVRTSSLYGNDVLFAGARWHADLGLYWMRNRWYDPYLGRFLTRDPIGAWGDPMNLGNAFAYVGNNPWTFVDPFGLCGGDGVETSLFGPMPIVEDPYGGLIDYNIYLHGPQMPQLSPADRQGLRGAGNIASGSAIMVLGGATALETGPLGLGAAGLGFLQAQAGSAQISDAILGDGTAPIPDTPGEALQQIDPTSAELEFVAHSFDAITFAGGGFAVAGEAATAEIVAVDAAGISAAAKTIVAEGEGAASILESCPAPNNAASLGNEIGILRSAAQGKGNFGVGSANAADAARLGESWVGQGAKVASDGKTLISADGLRQFRPPSFKPNLGRVQANFEQRWVPDGRWQGNGHLDIVP